MQPILQHCQDLKHHSIPERRRVEVWEGGVGGGADTVREYQVPRGNRGGGAGGTGHAAGKVDNG